MRLPKIGYTLTAIYTKFILLTTRNGGLMMMNEKMGSSTALTTSTDVVHSIDNLPSEDITISLDRSGGRLTHSYVYTYSTEYEEITEGFQPRSRHSIAANETTNSVFRSDSRLLYGSKLKQ